MLGQEENYSPSPLGDFHRFFEGLMEVLFKTWLWNTIYFVSNGINFGLETIFYHCWLPLYITCPVKYWMKLLVQSQTSTVAPLKFVIRPTLYNECNNLSMLWFKLTSVNKRGPWRQPSMSELLTFNTLRQRQNGPYFAELGGNKRSIQPHKIYMHTSIHKVNMITDDAYMHQSIAASCNCLLEV